MKIWLSKNSEIAVREQLMTQITLGIASGDLPIGKKLPSTRELARRFQIHPNTISSAYQKLAEHGLVEFKKGSGFYVCETKQLDSKGEIKLDKLINEFFQTAQSFGFSKDEIKKRLQKWLLFQAPEQFLVIESDKNLRSILIVEIRQATSLQVSGESFEKFTKVQHDKNAMFAAMIDEKPKIESILTSDKTCVFLKARSVSDSMTGETRPGKDDLIVVVSGWEKFLLWAKTILVAADIENDSIIVRSTSDGNWRRVLKNASMIICDALTAREISGDERVRVFRLIAADSLNELKNLTHTISK